MRLLSPLWRGNQTCVGGRPYIQKVFVSQRFDGPNARFSEGSIVRNYLYTEGSMVQSSIVRRLNVLDYRAITINMFSSEFVAH